jgi:hypothetical protein
MSDTLNIKDVLHHIDIGDVTYFNDLTTEQKKSISPYVIMLWMNGCKSPIQILLLNGIINELIFNLPSGHNELSFKLLMVGSDGSKTKYKWMPRKLSGKKYATCVKMVKRKYNCSARIALGYIKRLGYEDIAEIAIEYGEQDDILKKIKKELA